MKILTNSLHAKDIHLFLKATGDQDAVEELLLPLRGDERVKNWEKLRESLTTTPTTGKNLGENPPILLHHVRSEQVTDLVIAAGRSNLGILLSPQLGKAPLVFLAAIPEALNNEYLRILGAISRVCREEKTLQELIQASTPAEFLKVLEKGCRE